MKITSKKGFTLIELLVVIAVIGILAGALLVSLGGAREAGRDARRISDLRQVQGTLELYFNQCGRYPGESTCANTSPGTWDELETTLVSALGVRSIPQDPLSSRSYVYGVSSDGQVYVLQARLERSNQALDASAASILGDIDEETNPLNSDDALTCDIAELKYCVSL